MKIPKYARYDYCNQKACEFLEEFNIISFPIEPEEIIHQKKWGLVPYSELMEVFHCNRQQVEKYLGSKDGFTIWDDSNYTISYNDDGRLGDRTRFTLMHEIGHIYLNHLKEFEATKLYRGSLTKSENRVLENEANAFARNVLVPTSMLEHLSNKSIHSISVYFGITPSAAQTRLDLYTTDINMNTRLNVLKRLYNVFYKFYYKKRCVICNYGIITQNINYCPICGSKNTFQWGDGKMIYPKFDTHENGKLKTCPICQNEETQIEGGICQICGINLVNYCTNYECSNLEMVLPSNARYCPVCGNQSAFFKHNILKKWNYKEQDDPFMQIPDGIDEELPFAASGSFDEDLPFN